MELNRVDHLSDWELWKNSMAKAIDFGQTMGMEEKSIEQFAYRIGNVLSAAVDPENREQRLLQELWRSGDEEERKTISGLIVKMLQSGRYRRQ